MGIFARLATLIKSNLNDLISRSEDPEKMLNQVVIDMANQLIEAKKQVAVSIADEKRLAKQAEQEAANAAEWERRAMLAIKAGDDGLAKTPTRFDQALVGAGDRVLGEHDTGDAGVEKRLHDNTHARACEQPDALTVGDRRIRVGRPPDVPHSARDIGRRMDVQHGQVLTREACSRAVLVDGGRTDGERGPQAGDGLRHLVNGFFVP